MWSPGVRGHEQMMLQGSDTSGGTCMVQGAQAGSDQTPHESGLPFTPLCLNGRLLGHGRD